MRRYPSERVIDGVIAEEYEARRDHRRRAAHSDIAMNEHVRMLVDELLR
jgi:hypothetical protein